MENDKTSWHFRSEDIDVAPGNTRDVAFRPPFSLVRIERITLPDVGDFHISIDIRSPAINPGDGNLIEMNEPKKGCYCGSALVHCGAGKEHDVIRYSESVVTACIAEGKFPVENLMREGTEIVVRARNAGAVAAKFSADISGYGKHV